MRNPERIPEILAAVGDALLDKGEGYSIGQLVAELEGDGMTEEDDPFNVWDEHFQRDARQIGEWAENPRDPAEVEDLLDLFAEYWREHPDLRFCQIICNAHTAKNGVGDFDDGQPYAEPISELTDDQLREYLEGKVEDGS